MMPTLIIFVEGHRSSELYLEECIQSCKKYKGYDPIPFCGVTTITLDKWLEIYPEFNNDMPGSRLLDFKSQSTELYRTKKSCLINQARALDYCIDINTPIIVIEHDARAVRSWDYPDLSDTEFAILNIKSSYEMHENFIRTNFYRKLNVNKKSELLPYNSDLIYKREGTSLYGASLPVGLGAYVVTPKGAKKLLDNMKNLGAEQGDHIINNKNVDMKYFNPEYFTMSRNLRLSHGIQNSGGMK